MNASACAGVLYIFQFAAISGLRGIPSQFPSMLWQLECVRGEVKAALHNESSAFKGNSFRRPLKLSVLHRADCARRKCEASGQRKTVRAGNLRSIWSERRSAESV